MCQSRIVLFLILCVPLLALAQDRSSRLNDATSMEVMIQDSEARSCYRAAGIAARIHYASRRDVENCTYALERSAMSVRDRAATLTNRGIILMSLQEYDRALQDFTAALDIRPDFGEVHINMGNIYFLERSYNSAIEQYTAAIEKQSSRIHIAYINRGMAYERLENFDNAEQDYREAMTLLPDSTMVKAKLDEVLSKKSGTR